MPATDAASHTIEFPALYNGAQVIATAVARADQIDIVPVSGVLIEVELHVWEQLATRAIVAAHTRSSPPK